MVILFGILTLNGGCMYYLIDKESMVVAGRYYSYYVANKAREVYDGRVTIEYR